jgi:hypothetical protein
VPPPTPTGAPSPPWHCAPSPPRHYARAGGRCWVWRTGARVQPIRPRGATAGRLISPSRGNTGLDPASPGGHIGRGETLHHFRSRRCVRGAWWVVRGACVSEWRVRAPARPTRTSDEPKRQCPLAAGATTCSPPPTSCPASQLLLPPAAKKKVRPAPPAAPPHATQGVGARCGSPPPPAAAGNTTSMSAHGRS